MKVIIAEKPSLGRTIATAFNKMKNENGYMCNDNVIVTWAYGHLFELKPIEAYTHSDYKKGNKYRWNEIKYPFIPSNFEFQLKDDSGIKKQYKIIQELVNRNDVDEIISAGDADREGEVIIRLIINNALKSDKQLSRLWLPDQTVQTIKKEYQNRKAISEYDRLYDEGLLRTYIDWLIGINLTREVTIKSSQLFKIGRVVTPIVQAIYNRDNEINNFVPTKYLIVESTSINKNDEEYDIKLKTKEKYKLEELELAKEKSNVLNTNTLKVLDIKNKEEIKAAGKLFSLSKLQGVSGKKFKYSPSKTLELVQCLYEKGLVTYPRTNTEYLAEEEKEKVNGIINILSNNGSKVTFKDKKTIFDSSKIESHSAIIPTGKEIPNDLSQDELNIYNTINNRFISVFYSEDCILDVVEISLGYQDLDDEFTIKGTTIKQKGFTEVEEYNSKDVILPNFSIGEIINTNFKPIETETKPPKHYTVDTLNKYLRNPFLDEKKATEDEEYKQLLEGVEIGTEATRADTIDKAIKEKYIKLEKNTYYIQEQGINLINILDKLKLNLNAHKTVEMQKELKKVYRGEKELYDSLEWAIEYLIDFFNTSKDIKIENNNSNLPNRESLGKCPICSNDVYKVKGKYGDFYSCSNYKKCNFKINSKISNKTINETIVKKLLQDGKTNTIKGFKSKVGKDFEAKLILDKEGNIKFEFKK